MGQAYGLCAEKKTSNQYSWYDSQNDKTEKPKIKALPYPAKNGKITKNTEEKMEIVRAFCKYDDYLDSKETSSYQDALIKNYIGEHIVKTIEQFKKELHKEKSSRVLCYWDLTQEQKKELGKSIKAYQKCDLYYREKLPGASDYESDYIDNETSYTPYTLTKTILERLNTPNSTPQIKFPNKKNKNIFKNLFNGNINFQFTCRITGNEKGYDDGCGSQIRLGVK